MDVIKFDQPVVKKKKVVKKAVEPQDDKSQQNTKNYFQALERITQILKENNPSLATQTNIQLEKPIIDRLGSKKSLWKNFETICDQMHRDPQHVCQYFLIELGTQGAQADEKLIIKGRFTSPNIEKLIKKYLHEYVMCLSCLSSDTELIRDVDSRLYSKQCMSCKATKTVASLKMGGKK